MPDAEVDVRRKRDAARSKAVILDAAFEAFSEKGYVGATLRDIAARAGVTHGLVRRYFGTKEDLFIEAMPGTRDWADQVLSGGTGGLPHRIASPFVKRPEAGKAHDILIALLRSGADADTKTAKRLYEKVLEASLALHEPLLSGKDAAIRTEMLLSLFIGLTFTRHIMKSGPIAELNDAEFERYIARAIGGLVSTTDD